MSWSPVGHQEPGTIESPPARQLSLLIPYDETHLITKGVDGDTESPCKTEIPNLQFTSSVDEEILRFEITVQDSIIVTECDTLNNQCSFQSHSKSLTLSN